jgi:hypothetical protein
MHYGSFSQIRDSLSWQLYCRSGNRSQDLDLFCRARGFARASSVSQPRSPDDDLGTQSIARRSTVPNFPKRPLRVAAEERYRRGCLRLYLTRSRLQASTSQNWSWDLHLRRIISVLLVVAPQLGRIFTDNEAGTKAPIVVLSNHYWRKMFYANTQIIGTAITLDSKRAQGLFA